MGCVTAWLVEGRARVGELVVVIRHEVTTMNGRILKRDIAIFPVSFESDGGM